MRLRIGYRERLAAGSGRASGCHWAPSIPERAAQPVHKLEFVERHAHGINRVPHADEVDVDRQQTKLLPDLCAGILVFASIRPHNPLEELLALLERPLQIGFLLEEATAKTLAPGS